MTETRKVKGSLDSHEVIPGFLLPIITCIHQLDHEGIIECGDRAEYPRFGMPRLSPVDIARPVACFPESVIALSYTRICGGTSIHQTNRTCLFALVFVRTAETH